MLKSFDQFFEKFWSHYPRKLGKAVAKRKLKRRKEEDWQKIIDGVQAYAKHVKKTEIEFIKHASTWVSQECWEDEYAPVFKKVDCSNCQNTGLVPVPGEFATTYKPCQCRR